MGNPYEHVPAIPGTGIFFCSTFRDSDGNLLLGQNNYRLRVPADPSVVQFWQIPVYDVRSMSDRVGESLGLTRALLACVGLLVLGFVGMGWSEALFGFAFYYAICLARGLNGPLIGHVQQRLIPSADRASLLSINSLLFRATFFVVAPAIGLGIDRWGEHAALLLSGAVMIPLAALAIVWMAAVRSRSD